MEGLTDAGTVRLSAPALLSADHACEAFDCGVPVLNAWLKERALKSQGRYSQSYVVAEAGAVVGYYSLSAGSVQREVAPSRLRRNAPDDIPVALIGRLAVDLGHAGKGLGTDLLADALRRSAMASRTIGIAAIFVQAKDDAAKRFYLDRAKFIEFPTNSRTLFLPMEALAAALP